MPLTTECPAVAFNSIYNINCMETWGRMGKEASAYIKFLDQNIKGEKEFTGNMECKVDLFSEDSFHTPQGGIGKTGKSCGAGEGTISYEVYWYNMIRFTNSSLGSSYKYQHYT